MQNKIIKENGMKKLTKENLKKITGGRHISYLPLKIMYKSGWKRG